MPAKKKMSEKADKRYRSKIKVGEDKDGKIIYKYASGTTKKELAANAEELKKHFISGAIEVERDVLFDTYATSWFKTYKEGRHSAGSDENYHATLYTHLFPVLGKRQLRAITSLDLQALLNSKEGLGKATIGYIYGVLANVFAKATAQGIIDRNPALGLTKPKIVSTSRRALTDNEITATLKVGSEHPNGLLLLILYYTGLRRGEAMGLQWQDIDFQKRTISVQRDIDFKTGEIGGLKTKTSKRTVPIPDGLFSALYAVRGIGEASILQDAMAGNISRLQAYRNTWEDLMVALLEADKKIDHKGNKSMLTAHYYRHNYASLLYNGGVDVLSAQKWLGHADVKTTLSIYSHLSEGKEMQNAEKLYSAFKLVAEKLPERV